MGEASIRVEGLSKLYRIGERERYKTLRDTLAGVVNVSFRGLLSRVRKAFSDRDQLHSMKYESIWALNDVSFEVGRGEVLGIIGANGAGKTTILKILSRITEPTEGYAEIHGRVGSLLEVGTGFHPELTGRENIYLNGAVLGMKRFEINRKFDEIVAFSGVERFIDTPVKRYSSGMYIRLAFAVAAHLDPEVLLVDEVLAVGDVKFQEKCLGKMGEVARSGRTVLFVSHNMAAIRSLCSRVILFDNGRAQADGNVDRIIQMYLADGGDSPTSDEVDLGILQHRSGSGSVRIIRFRTRGSAGRGMAGTGKDAEFVIDYAARDDRHVSRLHVALWIADEIGNSVFGCATSMTALKNFHNLPPIGTIVCRIKELPLIPGKYKVTLVLKDEQGLADKVSNAASFVVRDGGDSGFLLIPSREFGNVVIPHEWDWLSSAQGPESEMSDTG